jgi:hypothetical protein
MKSVIKIGGHTIRVFCFSIAMIVSSSLMAQAPAIEWQDSFGGSGSDWAYAVTHTTDGGYVLAGQSNSNNGDVSGNHGAEDIWVAKISSTGNLEWQRSLGSGGTEWADSIQQTQDGGFIIAGRSNTNGGDVTGNHGSYDFWVLKLNASGTLLWQKSLGGSSLDVAKYAIETSDNGFLIVGSTSSNDGDVTATNALESVWVVKTNPVGVIEWQKTYGGSNNESANYIQPTTDGGFILTGYSDSNDGDLTANNGALDIWVFKIDAGGNLLWQKSYGGSANDTGQNAKQTSDGGYIIAGTTLSNDGDVSGNNGFIDGWLVRLDSTGNLLWQRAFGGSDIDTLEEVQLTPNGGFVIAGITESNNGDVSGNHGMFDYWTLLVNSTGTIVWQRPLGGSGSDSGYAISLTSDGGYCIAGASESNDGDVSGNNGQHDFWLVKMVPDPLLISEFDTPSVVWFPNPVKDDLFVAASENIEIISVYNLQGQKLFEQYPNELTTQLNTESFPFGTYIVQIISENAADTFKIIKE